LNQSFLGRLFDYGDIEILTASEIGVNKLHTIASPIKFKTEMLNQKEALGTDEHFGSRPEAGRGDVPTMIAELDALRKQGVLSEEEFQQKKAQLLSKM
ncbi:MAG: SHOCT domain-containing protein, partial [Chloroflexota bacterium]|nr:SHOCT domain-containing protein [Chloroflexota bacterium]